MQLWVEGRGKEMTQAFCTGDSGGIPCFFSLTPTLPELFKFLLPHWGLPATYGTSIPKHGGHSSGTATHGYIILWEQCNVSGLTEQSMDG